MLRFMSCSALVLGIAVATPLAAQQGMGHDSAMGKDAMGKSGAFVKIEASVTGGYAVATMNGHQVLSLTDDFTIGKSKAPFVVLSTTTGLSDDAVWLGELKQNKGAQSFDIPAGTDVSHFSHVVVWSKSAKKSLASADLSHSAMSAGN
jgi:hypothetical protein